MSVCRPANMIQSLVVWCDLMWCVDAAGINVPLRAAITRTSSRRLCRELKILQLSAQGEPLAGDTIPCTSHVAHTGDLWCFRECSASWLLASAAIHVYLGLNWRGRGDTLKNDFF